MIKYYISMLKKFKIALILLFLSLAIFSINAAEAKTSIQLQLKMEILDNLANVQQQYASDEYTKSYVGGIQIAIETAKKKGIIIEPTFVFYKHDPLEIYKVLPSALKINPDFIIGPRWSDQFLLIQNNFKNILVLSPFATAQDVYKMPRDFYTLGVPNSIIAHVFFVFLHQNLKNKKPFLIVQADCKNCVNLSEEIKALYKVPLPTSFYLENQAETIEIKTLLESYPKDSPILLLSTGYSAGILMARITDELKKNNTIFIGGDDWGSWKAWDAGKIKAIYPYKAYHITPWSLDLRSNDVEYFKKQFLEKYHFSPDNIGFATYQTVMSVVQAIIEYPNNKTNNKEKILTSFSMALNHDSNWFRPSVFAIYNVTPTGETLWKTVKITHKV